MTLPLQVRPLNRARGLNGRGRPHGTREKPNVFDHVRSVGPWMASIDEDPMVVLDGMSQTATRPGFRRSRCAAISTTCLRTQFCQHPIQLRPRPARHATRLRTAFETPHVSFTNSGAEANEKALALCRLNGPEGAHRVLAFQGSFHGRTLQSLHATWNPVKREPYELPGFGVTFTPFPLATPDYDLTQPDPDEFRAFVASGDMAGLKDQFGDDDDTVLKSEVESLCEIDSVLRKGGIYAVIVEPMQSEGGDRYGSHRFYRALRLLTRHHDVSLIFDEVQTGFGLAG